MKQEQIKKVIEYLMLRNIITEGECIRIWKEVLDVEKGGKKE